MDPSPDTVDRRGLLRTGGLAVAATAVLAACRDKGPQESIPISGRSAGYEPLPNKPVTDMVLLRTASSLEWSIVDAYRKILDNGWVTDAGLVAQMRVFHDHHWAQADVIAAATSAAGGTPCTGLNHKITDDVIQPVIQAIDASPESREEDAKALAHALEAMAAATYQAMVPALSQPALRRTAMSVGSVAARQAAVLAARLNPEVLVTSEAATAAAPESPTATTVVAGLPTTAPVATTTTVPAAAVANVIVAIPGTFGSLAPIALTVGTANENGVRRTTNLETPSLNSFLYEDEAC